MRLFFSLGKYIHSDITTADNYYLNFAAMNNFWKDLSPPVFTLAPMEDVTDTVFREIIMHEASSGYLKVVMSEFTSIDGLLHEVGGPKVKHRLFVNETERSIMKERGIRIVAQIWGSDPEKFFRAGQLISSNYNFDGIDINMGCPVKKIVKQEACSYLITQPQLAKEIILATMEGSGLPVSVKTRIGFKETDTEKWINHLMDAEPATISIHGRIQKQLYTGSANWDEIALAVKIRNDRKSSVLIHGNGDVFDLATGLEKMKKYKVDGVMIGRGIIGNPWFFSSIGEKKSPEEKLSLLLKHACLFTNTWKGEKNFAIMKRFFKAYTSDFPGAATIRGELMKTHSVDEVEKVLSACEYLIDF